MRRGTRTCRPPGEWWKVQTHREPTPAVESSEDEGSTDEADEYEDGDIPGAFLAGRQEDSEFAFTASVGPEPSSYRQALKRSDVDLWTKAAEEELDAHTRNGTWELADLPTGRKAIGSRWVFKVKRNADGSIEHYKARLVAKGFSQHPGFDFNETFAPTDRFAAIRTILALSALEDLHLHSIDISHAFINGDLDAEVYMEQPEGFEHGGPGKVLRLHKSIYGLKQASRMWYQKLQAVLIDIGFCKNPSLLELGTTVSDSKHLEMRGTAVRSEQLRRDSVQLRTAFIVRIEPN